MNLAEIKRSSIPKRRLFQIERAIVREATDLWCKERSYFSENFADDVEVQFKGRQISVSFANRPHMKQGSPEATVNDMMKGLILTMTTDQATGKLLKNHSAIIGNILDVFIHRLKETTSSKFILQRLQTLELGFSVTFGLGKQFYPIRKERRLLVEALASASLVSSAETVETLIHDIIESEAGGSREHGVTFHIIMEREHEASFISLPLGVEQSSYVSLLGTHTLRCNILAQLDGLRNITAGILKIDAPTSPRHFISHKGFDLTIDERTLMEKLGSAHDPARVDFTPAEMSFLKLLFNEYVAQAAFLLASNRIAPGLRLLIIFPRINIFKLLHAERPTIPPDEPQTLGELAGLHSSLFHLAKPLKKRPLPMRIPERVIQTRVLTALQALSRNILQNVYKPVTTMRRGLSAYARNGYNDATALDSARRSMEEISAYLRRLQQLRQVVLDETGRHLDVAASLRDEPWGHGVSALEEIISNIQAAEVEQSRDVVVSKMLDYLSFLTVRLEQLEKVASPYIKQEIVREMESSTDMVLLQARSFYSLLMGKKEPPRS